MSAPPPAGDRLPILDGHNDALLALLRNPERPDSLLERSAIGHLDLPRAADGGFAGGFFALFTPSRRSTGPRPRDAAGPYELPFPPTPGVARAQRFTGALAARLFRDERASGGRLKVVRTLAELRDCLERGVCAAILHIEGAEAIDPGLDALEVLYQTGLRSLGLVWSRPNAFGHGVPFKFPSSPDTGPGLTDARPGAGAGLQPARRPDRPLASERAAASGTSRGCRRRRWSRPTPTPTRCARSRAT